MNFLKQKYYSFKDYIEQSVSIAPLVVFRIAFGLVMLLSTLRYMYMGWIENQLVDPLLHFAYYGFDWVQPLGKTGMYAVFILMAISCLSIALGLFYRFFTILFFFLFTYVELIDITYYLNHYYFINIVSFLMIIVPANRYFSLDVKRKPTIKRMETPRWTINVFKVQIAIVYIYAGLAKINYDWLIEALPLKIWLPAKTSLPLIGWMFKYEITPYLFSWFGMLFDTFIVLGLLFQRTRLASYVLVVFFHTMVGTLFQIGIFPVAMILGVSIFFSADVHQKIIEFLAKTFKVKLNGKIHDKGQLTFGSRRLLLPFLIGFFAFQFLFPWRFILYPGNMFWTEEGYRFGWRVMLMEKAGTATFYVKDGDDGREGSVINSQFLNDHQEKQMAMQPDLILQYAHYLAEHFKSKGLKDPQVRVEAMVTLNGRPAQLLIDPEVDLTKKKDTWRAKDWILPYNEE